MYSSYILNKRVKFKKSKMENDFNKILNARFCERCRNYISNKINLNYNVSNCPWG